MTLVGKQYAPLLFFFCIIYVEKQLVLYEYPTIGLKDWVF